MPWLRSLAFALVLVVTCVAYIPARGERGDPALRNDAVSYGAMVMGAAHVPGPFRYRIAVPWLARTLPLPAERALALVSWTSLLATYALLLETARRLRIAPAAAALGLATAVFTAPHLYNYENPYLTDATGLLVVATSLYALVARRYGLFALTSVLGVSVREALMIITPGWAATRQWKRAALPVAGSLALFVTIQWLVGPDGLEDSELFDHLPARSLRDAAADALVAWHGLWLVAPVGLSLLATHRRELSWLAILLLAGALVTSVLASDTTRMFQPLFPLIALGTGAFVEELWRRSRQATLALLATCLASSIVWQPVRFLPFSLANDVAHVVSVSSALLAAAAFASTLLVWRGRQRSQRSVSSRAHGLVTFAGSSAHSSDSSAQP